MKSELGKDDELAVFCARLVYLQEGLRLVSLVDMQGRDSGARLLVRFLIQ
jgi:phosphatidylinositol phospholipase C, delta